MIIKNTAIVSFSVKFHKSHKIANFSVGDLTQLYIFTPSIHTIMTMGGLDLLWPLTNYLFLFKGAQIENLHREVFQWIRIFSESVGKFSDFWHYQVNVCHTDSKIEAYYRKYMDIEKQ